MDIISYAKAGKVMKADKAFNTMLGSGIEDKYTSVDERLDHYNKMLNESYIEKIIPVDFSKGTFTNTEITTIGALQLKKIPEKKRLGGAYTPNGNVPIAGLKVSGTSSSDTHNVSKMFDGILYDDSVYDAASRFIGLNRNGPAQILFENPIPIELTKYSWASRGDVTMPGSWKMEGSNDKVSWEVIDERKNIDKAPRGWREFKVQVIKPFKFHRWNISSKYDNSFNQGVNIYEMKMFSEEVDVYVAQGSWESNIIDLGGDWVETKGIDITAIETAGQTTKVYVSHSEDGIIFNAYQEYNPELINQTRFLKIKILLTSTADSFIESRVIKYNEKGNTSFDMDTTYFNKTASIDFIGNFNKASAEISVGIYKTDLTDAKNIKSIKEVF